MNFKSLSILLYRQKNYKTEVVKNKVICINSLYYIFYKSKKLLDIYPDEKEGIIDKKFANLVNKKTCVLIAKKLNLKKFISIGASHENLDRSDNKIISDCLEAVVGAIYLDGGIKAAEKFILNFWSSYIDKSVITLVDSKTQLQEYSLKKYKILPKYTFFKKTGPQHKPLFKTEVEIPK